MLFDAISRVITNGPSTLSCYVFVMRFSHFCYAWMFPKNFCNTAFITKKRIGIQFRWNYYCTSLLLRCIRQRRELGILPIVSNYWCILLNIVRFRFSVFIILVLPLTCNFFVSCIRLINSIYLLYDFHCFF